MTLKKSVGPLKKSKGQPSVSGKQLHKSMQTKMTRLRKKVNCPIHNRHNQRSLKEAFGKKLNQKIVPRVWRKTIVFTRPKVNLVPRLFRTDRSTGLPLDYERTVSRIMNYVNPRHSSSPSPEKMLERLLAQKLAGALATSKLNNLCSQHLKNQVRTLFNSEIFHSSKLHKKADNMDLCQFHCACKRGPSYKLDPLLPPTYKSKFNYNTLKIHTKE